MTFTRVHTSVTFANPFLVCGECGERAQGFHAPDRCGCESRPFRIEPCGHQAEALDTCPSWGPVDGCTCTPQHVAALRVAAGTPTHHTTEEEGVTRTPPPPPTPEQVAWLHRFLAPAPAPDDAEGKG